MTTRKTVATVIAVFALALAASLGGAELRNIADEANAMSATLAEMQASTSPESHPYFWFCPEPECAAVDGYVAWRTSHGGR